LEATISYKDLAAVSGKQGLFRIVKPTRSGVILESVDDQKKKFVAGVNLRISVLQEISVYTTSQEGVLGLPEVFSKIHAQYKGALPVDQKAEGAELAAFLHSIVPEYDREKVYTSDIRKLVNWYTLLQERMPEIFAGQTDKTEEIPSAQPVEDSETQKVPEAPKAKKTKKS
jgi:hypothetical protein